MCYLAMFQFFFVSGGGHSSCSDTRSLFTRQKSIPTKELKTTRKPTNQKKIRISQLHNTANGNPNHIFHPSLHYLPNNVFQPNPIRNLKAYLSRKFKHHLLSSSITTKTPFYSIKGWTMSTLTPIIEFSMDILSHKLYLDLPSPEFIQCSRFGQFPKIPLVIPLHLLYNVVQSLTLLETCDQNNRKSTYFCCFKQLRSPFVLFHTFLLNNEQNLTNFC